MVWETVPRNYFFIFFSPLEIGVFFLHSQLSSRYTLVLIGQYRDKIVSKCNRASSCVFMKVLALLWSGRQFPESISSFFLSSRNLGFLFAVSNCPDGFVCLSKKEMKLETNVIAILTQPSSVALKRCMTSPSYINIRLGYSLLISRYVYVRSSSLRRWWRQVGCICLRVRLNKVC
jgi:hypothetical protein